jgi:hypothetical protein
MLMMKGGFPHRVTSLTAAASAPHLAAALAMPVTSPLYAGNTGRALP